MVLNFSFKELSVNSNFTFNNNDFTSSSIWAFRNFYPNMRIILVDGGSLDNNLSYLKEFAVKNNLELMVLFDAPTEYCRNAGVSVVDTEYVLFMDNDAKILSTDAVDLCINVLDNFSEAAQTGAYALKIIDKEKYISYCGTEFNDNMEVTGFSAYFSTAFKSAPG